MRYHLLLPLLAAATPALADTLPLSRGVYVQRGIPCDGAANAVTRDYNGQGIGSSKAGQCTGSVLAQFRRRYTLRQNCVQYGGPRPHRANENVKIRVDSLRSYTDLKSGAHYRLCPGRRL